MEATARHRIQALFWTCFRVGLGNADDYFTHSRTLPSTFNATLATYYDARIGKVHSGEIDVFLYCHNPTSWKLYDNADANDFRPFCKTLLKSGLDSLNSTASEPYPPPISPPASSSNLFSPEQVAYEQKATYYVIFGATTRRRWLPDKAAQLEIQLATLILRFHASSNSKIPPLTTKTRQQSAFANFLAKEAKKLIAWTGFALTEDFDEADEKELQSLVNRNDGYDYPCLWSLLNAGRVAYVRVQQLSKKVTNLEEQLKKLKVKLGEQGIQA